MNATLGKGFLALVTLILLSGCAKSTMRFHFAAIEVVPSRESSPGDKSQANAEGAKAQLRFYRVTIKGTSWNSVSKLQTGYYDAQALHQLFGQVSSDGSGTKSKSADPGEQFEQVVLQVDPVTGRCRIVQHDQRFSILFGNNADAVTQQIMAFGEAQDTGEKIASLAAAAVGRDDFEALYSARTDASERQAAAVRLAEELRKIAEKLKDTNTQMTEAGLQAELLEAMRICLTQAGSGVTLPVDFSEAITKAQGAKEAMVSK